MVVINNKGKGMDEVEKHILEHEISIESAKANIEKAKALDRLKNNEDFKTIFLEGYFDKYASNLVLLKSSPAMEDKQEQLDQWFK